jgi:hypothetical protein
MLGISAQKTGRFMGEPSPKVTTMYTDSMSLALGVTGSSPAAESSAKLAAGALGVRIESDRLRRAATDGRLSLLATSIAPLNFDSG